MADNNQQPKKKGFSVKDALFGGGSGSSGNLYKIIYFTISAFSTDKGIEQHIIMVYGDENGIFTNMLPMMSVIFTYNKDVDGPYIKLSKSFLPGSGKAEILIPPGYSFMAPSIPHVIEAMPAPQIIQQVGQVEEEYEEPAFSTDDVLKMVNQAEADFIRAKEERQIQEQKAREAAEEAKKNPPKDSNDLNSKYIEPPKKPKASKIIEEPKVIDDGETFVASFDSEALSAKIDKFMDKHGAEKKKVESAPVKEVDPRTIEEVKKESVETEMERLFKNEGQFKKLEEDANADVKAAMEQKGNKK